MGYDLGAYRRILKKKRKVLAFKKEFFFKAEREEMRSLINYFATELKKRHVSWLDIIYNETPYSVKEQKDLNVLKLHKVESLSLYKQLCNFVKENKGNKLAHWMIVQI